MQRKPNFLGASNYPDLVSISIHRKGWDCTSNSAAPVISEPVHGRVLNIQGSCLPIFGAKYESHSHCKKYLFSPPNLVKNYQRHIMVFYLGRFSKSRSSSGSTLSVCLSVRNTFGVPSLIVLSVTSKVFIPFYSNFE